MIEIINANNNRFTSQDHKQLYDIIIKGYELTEAEIWGEKYIRIFPEAYNELIDRGEVLVALLNNNIVGGIHYYKINEATYGFSLLASDFKIKGQGVGTTLIKSVEKIALKNKSKQISIEILRIKSKDVDCKIILSNYYNKLGYVYTHSLDCSCKIDPIKYKKLVEPANFDFYVKQIQ